MLITCTKLPIGNLNINNYHISSPTQNKSKGSEVQCFFN